MKEDALSTVFRCARIKQTNLLIPAIRIIGNILIGTHKEVMMIINEGVLELALELIEHPKKIVRK